MFSKEMPSIDEVLRVVVCDEKRVWSIVDARRFLFRRQGDDFFALTRGRTKWLLSMPTELEPFFPEPDSSLELPCTFDPEELTGGPLAVIYGDRLITLNPA